MTTVGSLTVWGFALNDSPVLDLQLTLPEAESLRKVVKEIDSDMEKIRKDRDAQRADLALDYGPDHAYYLLKDKCIEKKIEVRVGLSTPHCAISET